MSNYKTLKGLFIKHVSSDPSNLIEGQIWYNTTTQVLKVAPQITSWASGGDMNKAYNKPTKKITIIRIDKLLINLLFNERILLGKKFFNMKIFYIKI